jgi:uncharacterized protein YigE (DUF2233 family)
MRGLVVLLLGLAACGEARVAAPCGPQVFEGESFTVCAFDARVQEVRLAWRDADAKAYRSFAALARDLPAGDVAFAMNGGMYDDAGAPIGLYVEHGDQRHAISTRDGPGNFHLKPNGVFWVDAAGDPHVSATEAYLTEKPEPVWATQSGPMLVIDGAMHPAFSEDGESRFVRNGVGVTGEHEARFVISDRPVSFGKMARFFRDGLKSDNALYLDGTVSSLWAPSLQRMDGGFPLGPMIVVRAPD